MKRNRERIRSLLQDLEGAESGLIMVGGTMNQGPEEVANEYHLELMSDEGLVLSLGDGCWRLTSLGQDAVEAIDDSVVWEKLKAATPMEAYQILKGVGSTLAVTALSKLMGWG